MSIKLRNLALMLFISAPFIPMAVSADTVKVATIDWCPQICDDSEKPGYMIEILESVFKDSNYELDVSIMPWPRAIKMVERGRFDVLLAATKEETPSLQFVSSEIGVQQMCLFTKASSTWNYTSPESIKGLQIGAVIGGHFGEIHSLYEQSKGQFQMLPDENYMSKSMSKLDAGRIDAFMMTYGTTVQAFEQAGVSDKYRSAGCVSRDPVYPAFTPNRASAQKVSAIAAHFDKGIAKLNGNGELTRSWRSMVFRTGKQLQYPQPLAINTPSCADPPVASLASARPLTLPFDHS